ncbi:hypothetical protein J2Z48_001260 [Croceifilum oryzae]|uniref:PD-(D/E)XK motif protein n=1 Tax=Croceifilum oryzae TaxID=1553429 RepID=A0AAJ1WSK7_9BACL|nr:PD-(D/E)XK motif protein [Croceifilum oryzae]MDQ0417088.1 hypothetical protein [Croceifilum oryzae]
MIDIRKILDGIDTEISSPHKKFFPDEIVVRLLKDKGDFSIFIGVSPYEKRRMLLVSVLFPLTKDRMESLPCWNGVKIYQKQLGQVLHLKGQWFVIVEQETKSDHEIYESLIANIYTRIVKAKNKNNMLQSLQQTLEQWHYFFSNQEAKGLSIEAQQGLFGELYVLQDLIQKGVSPSIIRFWRGPYKEDKDIMVNDLCIEVKTSKVDHTNKGSYIHISNERQLSADNQENLYLSVVMLRVLKDNASGSTLNQLVAKIRNSLTDWPIMLDLLDTRLVQAGFLDIHFEKYEQIGYIIVREHLFHVGDDFPRITCSEVPHGVHHVKYTILLDSCMPFETSQETLIRQLQEKIL